MIAALLALQVLTLFALVLLWLRKPDSAKDDPRLAALPDQVLQLTTRVGALSDDVRGQITQLRSESAETSRALREEVQGSIRALGTTLSEGLTSFRADNKTEAETLRKAVDMQLQKLAGDFAKFAGETAQRQLGDREALHTTLNQMRRENTEQGDKLKGSVQESLHALSKANEGKLEEMRATVDEKLQRTLNERLTHSFGQVTTHLGEVQKGLGEMKELASGVGDLKKVLTGVKTRGIVGEFLLGQQLEQMFSPEQYVRNARIKPGTTESVEYALKFPNGPESHVLLAIDSKFPREVGERLMAAYDAGNTDEAEAAGKEFERAIRFEGKKICDKYIDPPTTLPHAIMFLPTEFLYAEVVRRPGLQSELQQNCRVTIAGPSTFMAILTSFQMGFHTIAIEKKGNEVWKVLAGAKKEFETFGGLMESMEKQVGTVQNTIQKLGTRSRAITRTLREVGSMETSGSGALMAADTVLPLLAASEDED